MPKFNPKTSQNQLKSQAGMVQMPDLRQSRHEAIPRIRCAPGRVTAVGCLAALSLFSVQVSPPPAPRQSGVDCGELSTPLSQLQAMSLLPAPDPMRPVAGFSSPDQRRAVSCAEVGHA